MEPEKKALGKRDSFFGNQHLDSFHLKNFRISEGVFRNTNVTLTKKKTEFPSHSVPIPPDPAQTTSAPAHQSWPLARSDVE